MENDREQEFYDWLKRTHPEVRLGSDQRQLVMMNFNPQVKVQRLGGLVGKRTVFRLINEFNKQQVRGKL